MKTYAVCTHQKHHWGTSNEYQLHMFSWRNKKNIWILPLICVANTWVGGVGVGCGGGGAGENASKQSDMDLLCLLIFIKPCHAEPGYALPLQIV